MNLLQGRSQNRERRDLQGGPADSAGGPASGLPPAGRNAADEPHPDSCKPCVTRFSLLCNTREYV